MDNSENTEEGNNDEFVANVLEVITIEDDDEKECAVTMEEECAIYTTIDDNNSLKSETKEADDQQNNANDDDECAVYTVKTISLETAAAEDQQNSANSNNDEEKKRSCRLCHGSDEDEDSKLGGIDQEWVQPCKCSGTLKWVHRGCFTAWQDRASYQQRTQCSMCSYFFRFSPRLKPRWFTQQFDVQLQILLAVLATSKLVYDLASLDLHAIIPSFLILCLAMALALKEYRLQLELLEQHKMRLQMRELHGQMFWHVTGEQQHETGLQAIKSSQSVFEEAIQDSI